MDRVPAVLHQVQIVGNNVAHLHCSKSMQSVKWEIEVFTRIGNSLFLLCKMISGSKTDSKSSTLERVWIDL